MSYDKKLLEKFIVGPSYSCDVNVLHVLSSTGCCHCWIVVVQSVCEARLKQLSISDEKLAQDQRRKADLTRVPPTEEEVAVLRSLQLPSIDPVTLRRVKAYVMPSSQMPMAEAQLQTTSICMPQEVNAYKTLLGGFQMRTAYDTAFQLADKFV